MKISEDRKVIYANGLAGRVNIVKVTILPKAILRFNAISIKIPTQFFIDLERAICNFHQTNRKHRRGENVLNTKKNSGRITIHDLYQYYRAIVIKSAWY